MIIISDLQYYIRTLCNMNTSGNMRVNNTELSDIHSAYIILSEGLLSLFIVIGHIVAISLIRQCRLVPMSVIMLIMNLCVIDITAGIWGAIRLSLKSIIENKMFCDIEIFVLTTLYNISVLLVTFIALDRFCSLFYPMRYTYHVTKSLYRTVCLFTWSFGIVLSTMVIVSDLSDISSAQYCTINLNYQYVIPWLLFTVRFTCIVILCFAYVKIYIKSREISKLYYHGKHSSENKTLIKVIFIVVPHITVHLFNVTLFFLGSWVILEDGQFYESHLFTLAIVVDMWVYVIRFEECRLHFMIKFWFWNIKRKQVYEKRLKHLQVSFLTSCPSSETSGV